MKFLSYFFILNFLLFSCQKKEIFNPVNQKKENIIKESQEYSKIREHEERKYLQQWVNKQKDSLNKNFEASSGGIWFYFIRKENNPPPKINNRVTYTAKIKTLTNQTIYSETEFGTKSIILGKYKEIRGIETALYKMGKGDIAELLLPSFTAYGLYGDENKIGADVPLWVELHVLETAAE